MMRIPTFFLAMIMVAPLSVSGNLRASELRVETERSWQEYLRVVDARAAARLAEKRPFLRMDEIPGRPEQLRTGEIVAEPESASGMLSVPGGLIHHWIGAAFIDQATLETVINTIHDYPHYAQFYRSTVAESRLLSRDGSQQNFSMLWVRHTVFKTIAIENTFDVKDLKLDGRRWYTVATTTRIQEIENYDSLNQRLLPPDHGCGFLWRIRGIVRYEERDGGVYMEMEGMALSRDVPQSLKLVVNPLIERASRSALVTTLQQSRNAVKASVSRGGQSLRLSAATMPASMKSVN